METLRKACADHLAWLNGDNWHACVRYRILRSVANASGDFPWPGIPTSERWFYKAIHEGTIVIY